MAPLPDTLAIDNVVVEFDEATDTKDIVVGIENVSDDTVTESITVDDGHHTMEHEVIVDPGQTATIIHPASVGLQTLTVGGIQLSV